MDYRTIQGVDGEIRLDKVILGASSFGANISKELSYQMMDRYYEIGEEQLIQPDFTQCGFIMEYPKVRKP